MLEKERKKEEGRRQKRHNRCSSFFLLPSSLNIDNFLSMLALLAPINSDDKKRCQKCSAIFIRDTICGKRP
jgi:hypothetical protein